MTNHNIVDCLLSFFEGLGIPINTTCWVAFLNLQTVRNWYFWIELLVIHTFIICVSNQTLEQKDDTAIDVLKGWPKACVITHLVMSRAFVMLVHHLLLNVMRISNDAAQMLSHPTVRMLVLAFVCVVYHMDIPVLVFSRLWYGSGVFIEVHLNNVIYQAPVYMIVVFVISTLGSLVWNMSMHNEGRSLDLRKNTSKGSKQISTTARIQYFIFPTKFKEAYVASLPAKGILLIMICMTLKNMQGLFEVVNWHRVSQAAMDEYKVLEYDGFVANSTWTNETNALVQSVRGTQSTGLSNFEDAQGASDWTAWGTATAWTFTVTFGCDTKNFVKSSEWLNPGKMYGFLKNWQKLSRSERTEHRNKVYIGSLDAANSIEQAGIKTISEFVSAMLCRHLWTNAIQHWLLSAFFYVVAPANKLLPDPKFRYHSQEHLWDECCMYAAMVVPALLYLLVSLMGGFCYTFPGDGIWWCLVITVFFIVAMLLLYSKAASSICHYLVKALTIKA